MVLEELNISLLTLIVFYIIGNHQKASPRNSKIGFNQGISFKAIKSIQKRMRPARMFAIFLYILLSCSIMPLKNKLY